MLVKCRRFEIIIQSSFQAIPYYYSFSQSLSNLHADTFSIQIFLLQDEFSGMEFFKSNSERKTRAKFIEIVKSENLNNSDERVVKKGIFLTQFTACICGKFSYCFLVLNSCYL